MSLQVYKDPKEDCFRSAVLLHVYRYWQGKCDGDRLPARSQIAPGDMVPALPHLMLVDVEGDDAFRFRLIGTSIVEHVGRDATGTLLQETYVGDDFKELVKDYQYVRDERRPCLTVNSIRLDSEPKPLEYRRLLLPLSRDGDKVDMILGVMQFLD